LEGEAPARTLQTSLLKRTKSPAITGTDQKSVVTPKQTANAENPVNDFYEKESFYSLAAYTAFDYLVNGVETGSV
jgi:hypothetical protein